MVMPTPTAGPLQAAMVGFSESYRRKVNRPPPSRWPSRPGSTGPRFSALKVLAPPERSAPAQKPRPAAGPAAGAGEDHRTHVVVAIGAVQRIEQLRQHLSSEGVELVGPVQGDGEDAVLGLVLDLLVGHGSLLSSG